MLAASLIFDVISIVSAMAIVGWRLIGYRTIRVDHVVLFCIGHAYYLSLSSIMVSTGALGDTYWFVYSYFADASAERRLITSLWSLGLLVSFCAGAFVGSRPTAGGERRQIDTSPGRRSTLVEPAKALTAVMSAVFFVVVLRYRSVVLEGYRSLDPANIQAQSGRGILSAFATATILSALLLLHVASACAPGVRRRSAAIAAATIALPSVVLLLAGGRMYVATSLVAITVWISHVRRPIARGLIVAVALVGFMALTVLGSLRTGEVPDRSTVGFYATSESVLTSISQGTFLSSDREVFMPVRVPIYLASDISNAIPRFVLPTKDSLRLNPEDDGFRITSALGATHLQASSLINFGLVGSLAAFAIFAFGLSRLKLFVLTHPSSIWSLSYACMSAVLLFSVFRDPFSISIVRWVIVNALVVPITYLAILTVLRRRPLAGSVNRVTATQTPH